MISVDVCHGREALKDVPPEKVGKYLWGKNGSTPPNGDGSAPLKDEKAPVVWLDMMDPTDADWAKLKADFHFHPLAIEDARQQGQRAKMDDYDTYLFLSIPAWKGTKGGGDKNANALQNPNADVKDERNNPTEELDIFVGPNYLVTIHNGPAVAIDETRKRMEKHPEHTGKHAGYLLYLLLDSVVDAYFPAMDSLDEAIDELETAVYEGGASGIIGGKPLDVAPALRLKRELLLLRQAVSPMRDVLNALLRVDDPALMPPDLAIFYQDVYDHSLRLTEQVDLHRDLVGGVLDAIVAQTSNRMNQVMKTLTAISTILMSAALVAGIYGMNFKNMPELDWRWGYFYALALMGAIGGGLATYFKRIGWF